jgi:transcriptional regulator with XRE-family HTH domain
MNQTPPMTNDDVAENLRAVLARRRIPQTTLAASAGMSPTYLNRRLTGAATISVADLARLAASLDLPLTDLLPQEATA